MSNILEELTQRVIEGKLEMVKELTRQAIASGLEPEEIINQGLIMGMNVVGVRFKAGDMYVPEVLMCARSMSGGMELVKPLLMGKELPSAGKVLIGTVKGDLHDIGKNLVAMLLESVGFTVINLGTDISTEQFIQAIKEHNPDVLGLSALLTTTMLGMKDVIDQLVEEGMRDKIKVIIGGAPISQEFSDEIGADGFAPDGASATELCQKLLA
ncbi:MAG TPA: corrinoid protein [Desulfosporosinus sp.]|nr:corrinoid protein [Desulfosporosinus sp.]